MGAYAELRKPEWLAAQMVLKEFDCADVARHVNAVFGSATQPQIVSRQFVSQLKTGRKKRCTPALAERICSVLDVELDLLFVVSEPRSSAAQIASTTRTAGAA
jgi:hypothetical protein